MTQKLLLIISCLLTRCFVTIQCTQSPTISMPTTEGGGHKSVELLFTSSTLVQPTAVIDNGGNVSTNSHSNSPLTQPTPVLDSGENLPASSLPAQSTLVIADGGDSSTLLPLLSLPSSSLFPDLHTNSPVVQPTSVIDDGETLSTNKPTPLSEPDRRRETVGIAVGASLGVLLLLGIVILLTSVIVVIRRRHRQSFYYFSQSGGLVNPLYDAATLSHNYSLHKDVQEVDEGVEEDREAIIHNVRTQSDPTERSSLSLDFESIKKSVSKLVRFGHTEVMYHPPAQSLHGLHRQFRKYRIYEIPRYTINIGEIIGSGEFGDVYKGVWQKPGPGGALAVALKMVKPGSSEQERVKFLQEAAIIGQFHHKNVLTLHGVATYREPVLMVLELIDGGNLTDWLKDTHLRTGEDPLLISQLPHLFLSFCNQIASGMEYLSSKKFVHRDLAARNILLVDGTTCKIADFGMSRKIVGESKYHFCTVGRRIPVKWTAPEAIYFSKYCTASDVWSFGIVAYEIWSLGGEPFPHLHNIVVCHEAERGVRMAPPPGCPRAIYELMMKCWNPDKNSRPTFSAIVEVLNKPEEVLLHWSEEDRMVHPQASVLGAPLDAASKLYLRLQRQYLQNRRVSYLK